MIPFCGPSYWISDRKAEVQRTVNLYTAVAYDQGKGRAIRLEPIPGLTLFEAAHAGWDETTITGNMTLSDGGYVVTGRSLT